jgi:nucleoid-associated protein YgaU
MSVPSRYRYSPLIRRGVNEYYGFTPQYDTSRKPGDQYYMVQAGDTLHSIAWRLLGDVKLWWVVSDFNDVIDPFEELEQGSVLRLPSRARLWMEVLQ